ncbi:unnamed protein product, partial [Prorocentrum cordatum]
MERLDGRADEDAPHAESHIFALQPVPLETLGVQAQRRTAAAAAANGSVLAAFQGGDVVRWYPAEDEASPVDFGREGCGGVGRILLEPKGLHALVANSQEDTWHVGLDGRAQRLQRLQGHVVEAASWDPESTETSTHDVLLGTFGGQILHLVVEGGKEKTLRALFAFTVGLAGEQHGMPVCGVCRERVLAADGSERTVVFVAAGCGLYAFVGSSLDTVFQRCQGEVAMSRALVFEVPRDAPHGDLQLAPRCVGAASSKVLFWLTGVGILAATVKCPLGPDGALLESPPGLIRFPRSPRAARGTRSGGSPVSALLPETPPPPPLSMALTPYHLVLLFEDRWVVVSRVSSEVVQQHEWSSSVAGSPREVVADANDDRVWLRSEKGLFELRADREDRNVWTMLVKQEQWEDALHACKGASQRAQVLTAYADWLFRQGRLVEAARRFAESTAAGSADGAPFEHVALRFLRAGCKDALSELMRQRMERCPKSDKVLPRVSVPWGHGGGLGVWAVEMALGHLNDISARPGGRARAQAPAAAAAETDALEERRQSLREFLRKRCCDLDVHATLYHLLQSHGWLEELVDFAEKLAGFAPEGAAEALVCRFAPVLFGVDPPALVSLLLRPQLQGLDPRSVLPALYAPGAPRARRAEAIRYLEHVLREMPEVAGQLPGGAEGAGGAATGQPHRQRSLRINSDQVSGALGDEEAALVSDGHGAAGVGTWASGAAIVNALAVLYACCCADGDGAAERAGDGPSGAEEELLYFLAGQEGNPVLDAHFALRVCAERGLSRVVVLLYGLLELHEAAVDVALRCGDVELAKRHACRPADRAVRQRLWLRVAESRAASGDDIARIMGLISESQEVTVRDLLPHLAESITVDALKDEICASLSSYEEQMRTLRQEMDDHRRALLAFKEDLDLAEGRRVVISHGQLCEICQAPALGERFYAFPCGHCFHEGCLRELVVPSLSVEGGQRLFTLEATRMEQQAPVVVNLGGLPGATLDEVEEELDTILADDCAFCGRLMVRTVGRPFIDPTEEDEAESWSVMCEET